MRAIVCREHGMADKLTFEADWAEPSCADNEVLVEVKAGGLNFPDVLMIQGKYQMQPDMPFIPGAECAGIVKSVGKDVSRFKAGDKVMVMGGVSSFAELCSVDQNAVMPMPEGVSFVEAAGIAMTYFTSYHALKQRANLKAGETVFVMGAGGGVGITAVEIAKAMGAKVIAAASSDEKLELAKAKGADEVFNYTDKSIKDTLKELTGGKGVDVIYDPVGGDFAEPALRAMAWNGRYLVIGFASGPIPKIPLNLALLKGCSIVGVFFGAFMGLEPKVQEQNRIELWEMFAAGTLKPVVTDVFPMEQYEAAFNCLAERKAKGKVIIEI